jgi:cytochrome c biogenesis protein CcdA/thiol-disulfide isomerase/thioredoxin
MLLLLIFAFLAGVITILSPCILPILPIILSSTIGTQQIGKARPLGVITGFILSFTFFTLFLSSIVKLSGIPSESLRQISIVVIFFFGLSLLVPSFQNILEKLFSKLAVLVPNTQNKTGFFGGLFIGLAIGLLWTPCVGPILASVISLAISGEVTFDSFLITLAYSIGTAIPMFIIMITGQNTLQKIPFLLNNLTRIQKIFGVIMILTAIAIFFNLDRKFQTFVITTFPNYGTGLIQLEENQTVIDKLQSINSSPMPTLGKPMFDITPKGSLAPALIPGGAWLNSPQLTLEKLHGKVVLIDFWTYSCINCQRTIPYLKSWHDKYADKGLVIIGVHSPEFEFEKNQANVEKALKDFGITYPVVQDNNFATWKAYSNRYWPAKYFIDKDGFIRYTHFGEGDYNNSEKIIQQLLQETGSTDLPTDINNPTYDIYSKTHETYLGYSRIEDFGSPEKIIPDATATYSLPQSLPNNYWALSGTWSITPEYATPTKGAALEINFESKEVFLVMRPTTTSSRVRVTLDGKSQFPGQDNIEGFVTVDTDRLYKLINLVTPGRHTLKLEFEDSNIQLFAFTFG